MKASKPYLKVTYDGKDITEDITRSLVSVSYGDALDEADILDIVVEDSDNLWKDAWFPDTGATITAEIGADGQPPLKCGKFSIDEIECTGAPDQVTIKCISAGYVKGQLRTKKSHIHEGKTLSELIRTLASSCGLKVQGQISNVRVGRLVQRRQSDLRTLRRLANQYGYTFNVRDDVAVFMKRKDLELGESKDVLTKDDMVHYSFRYKSAGTYVAAEVSYLNPSTGQTNTYRAKVEEPWARVARERGEAMFRESLMGFDYMEAVPQPVWTGAPWEEVAARGPTPGQIQKAILGDLKILTKEEIEKRKRFERLRNQKMATLYLSGARLPVPKTDDVLAVTDTAETKAQAQEMAEAALADANRSTITGVVTVPGRATLCAGNVITLLGFGRFDGNWVVKTSTHTVSVSEGWITDLEIYQIV